MKKYALALALAACLCAAAHAGEVEVTWQDADNFSDIRSGNENRVAFRAQLFHDLELVFQDLARQLPADVTWKIKVTDVDLAGEVRPAPYGNEIRIIKEIYWPRISLQSTLLDANQKILSERKEVISDMNFMVNSGMGRDGGRFQYEEKMLRDWFKKQQREHVFPSK